MIPFSVRLAYTDHPCIHRSDAAGLGQSLGPHGMNLPHNVFPVESGGNGLRVKGCVCELRRGEKEKVRKETRCPRDLVQSRRSFKEVTTVARDFNTNETEIQSGGR